MSHYRGSRAIERHEKCQNGTDCKGPGCSVQSGKTARNEGRAHPNRTNVGAQQAETTKGKKK